MSVRIISREEWGGAEPVERERLPVPVRHVILKYHGKSQNPCFDPAECRQNMRLLQNYQMKILNYPDIEYNFYIGADGSVYEGRGWTTVAKKEHELSGKSLDIVYIGDFSKEDDVPPIMEETFKQLVQFGVENEYISEDYKLEELRLEDLATLEREALHTKGYKNREKAKRSLRAK